MVVAVVRLLTTCSLLDSDCSLLAPQRADLETLALNFTSTTGNVVEAQVHILKSDVSAYERSSGDYNRL